MPNPFARRQRTTDEADSTVAGPFARTSKRAAREKNKLQDLVTLAKKKGVDISQELKGKAATGLEIVGDALSRTEYMGAGYAEEAAKHGPFSPEAAYRLGSEAFSGLPGVHGQKKTFGKVYEDIGVPEMGRPGSEEFPGAYSETGEGLKLRKGGFWDPTRRDLLGGLSAGPLDPLNYLSFGVGTGAEVVARGAAKAIKLSEKGMVERAAMAAANAPRAEKLAARLVREMKDVDPVTLVTKVEEQNALAQKLNEKMVSEALAERIQKDGLKELVDPGGIKWAGRSVVPGSALAPFGKAGSSMLQRVTKNPVGAQIMSGVRSVGSQLDRTFQETLGGARKLPGYERMVEEWRTGKRWSRGLLSKWIDDTFQGITGSIEHQGRKMPMKEYIRRAAENPQVYPPDLIPAEYSDIIPKMREANDHWFETELKEKIMSPEQYRQGYVPLLTKNTKEQMQELTQQAMRANPNLHGDLASLGPFGETRAFKNLDEMEAFHKELKDAGLIKWDLKPITDPADLMWRRGLAHYTALHGQRFQGKVTSAFGHSLKEVQFETFRRALPGVAEAVATGDKRLLGLVTMDDINQAAGGIAGVLPEKVGDYPFTAKTPLKTPRVPKKTVRYPVTEPVTEMVDYTPEPRTVPGIAERQPVDPGLGYTSATGPVVGKDLPKPTTWQPPSFQHPKTSDVTKIVSRTDPARAARQLSPAAKALILSARLRESANPEDFLKNLARLRPELADVDPNLLHAIDRTVSGQEHQVLGGAFGEPIITVNRPGSPAHGRYLPKAVVDDWVHKEDLIPATVLKEFGPMLAAYDRLMTIQKTGQTVLWPAFNTRNHISNVASNFVDLGYQAFNTRRVAQVVKLMAGGEGTVVTPGRSYTFDEYRKILARSGISNPVWAGNENLRSVAMKSGTGGFARSDAANAFRIVQKGGQKIEELTKVMNHMTHMERGLTPTEAGIRTHAFLFDYEQLSPREKTYFRRIFPYWTWMRKNVTLTAKQLAKQPGRYAQMVRLTNRDRGPDEEALPDYYRGELKLKWKEDGKNHYAVGLDLPLNSAIETAVPESAMQAARNILSQASPAIKIIPELAMQQEAFSGKDFSSREQLGPMLAPLVEQMPQSTQEWLGYNPKTKDMNYGKAYLLFRSWAVGRAYGYMKRIPAKPDEVDNFAINLLSGLKLLEYDKKTIKEAQVHEAVKRVEEKLKRTGHRKSFEVTYEP